MGFLSGAFSAVTGLLAGDDNADAAEDQARRERERIKLDLQRHRRNVRRVRGEQQVQFVAAGVVGNTGSALDIIADTQEQADLDAKIIEAGGEARASFAEASARQARLQGASVFAGGLLAAAEEFI